MCHDTQHEDTQHNVTQRKGLISDIHHNENWHSDTQRNGTAITLNAIVLSVAIFYCYAECHYAERRYAECYAPALLANITLGRKGLPGTNSQAYLAYS